ncbi:AvrE-family type 3 secretion system effector [Dickeya ananatis]
MTLDVRFGGSLSAGLGTVQQHGLKFTLSEKELPGFIDNLMEGKVNPLELVAKGNDHRVKEGFSIKFDVDAALTADARAEINLTDKPAASKKRQSADLGDPFFCWRGCRGEPDVGQP